MDKFDELKSNYIELKKAVFPELREDREQELSGYITGAMLYIWSGNGLYSPDYSSAIKAVTGIEYSFEQLMTAMHCCGEEGREMAVPEFFREFAGSNSKDAVTEVLSKLNEFLTAAAFINGDFTIEEANKLSLIIDGLKEYCSSQGVTGFRLNTNTESRVTPLKNDSYIRRKYVQEKPEPVGIVSSNEQTNAASPQNSSDTGSSETVIIAEKSIVPTADVTSYSEEDTGETLQSLLDELDGLVGLENVKKDIHSLMNFIKVSKLRESRGMKVPTISYHLVFTGNPGTGKTTVARLVAKLYFYMGILSGGQLVEADRSTLVAGYLGQTAIKTQKVIQQALGGVDSFPFITKETLENKEMKEEYLADLRQRLKTAERRRSELTKQIAEMTGEV